MKMLCNTYTLLYNICIVSLLHPLLGSTQPSNLQVTWNNHERELSCQGGQNSEVVWKKDNLTYSPDGSRSEVRANGVLHFTSTRPQDEGNWTCSVGDVHSEPFRLVLIPQQFDPVHANYELHTDFTLPCNVEIGPLAKQDLTEIIWSRSIITDAESSSISESIIRLLHPAQYNDTHIPSRIEGHVLLLSNFSLSVSNFNISAPENVSFVKYTCCVQLSDTVCGDTIINISSVPPSFSRPLPPITIAHPGQNISLEVQIKSYPQPTIEWNTTLDQKDQKAQKRIEVLAERQANRKQSVSTLKFSNLTVEDSGLISVRTSMCESSNTSETLLIVLPSVESVSITCTPDEEKTVLMFTLPSGFPVLRTDSPGLSFQLALNFTPISPTLEQLLEHRYERVLNLTYNEVLLGYLGPNNLLQLNTKRDIPEEVLRAVEKGVHFRVQAKLVVNNTRSKEWSKPCKSAVFASHSQCQMDDVEITLTIQAPQGTCSELQMNTRVLAKRLELTFRENYLDCKKLTIFNPILNCVDDTQAKFIVTLRAHKPQLLREKLMDNLMVHALPVAIGEETIPVTLEMIDQPPTRNPDKVGYSTWKIVAIVAILLLLVIVLCIMLSIILYSCTHRKKSHVSKHADLRKAEEGLQKNTTEDETVRYVDLESLSRQTSVIPAIQSNISSNLNGSPSNENTVPESRETSLSGSEDELSTVSESSASSSDSVEQQIRVEAVSCVLNAMVQKEGRPPTRCKQKERSLQARCNSDSKIKATPMGKSSMLHVSPVQPRSPYLRTNNEGRHKDSTESSQTNTPVKRISLAAVASQTQSHRRTFSDPSPSLEHIRQLQLEASTDKCGDSSTE